MRSYTGAIAGGQGQGGDQGEYVFTPAVRPFTAVGAEARLSFDVSNRVVATQANDLENVHTVPDPYYVTSSFEQTTDNKIIKFVNLPAAATIRIYSSSGVLVALLNHNSGTLGGSIDWNVRNRNEQVVASGVYFYHVEAGDARRVGRFTVVNFAQ
ncbi:MAG: T9SS type A sorting domain-containing protein [Gemmatimonadales bacterium]|nr:T9SS type A sorting domain-containing protein [Gemmatimonadales bacterium]